MQMKLLLPILMLLPACEQEPEQLEQLSDPVVAEPHDKYLNVPATPDADEEQRGPKIAVSSDPKANYTDEGSGVLPSGNLWLITRRDGPSGVSFAKREIDCASGTFRYMQEGDSLESMSDTNHDEMGVLTEGSISTLVSDYVCRKHRRGGVRGV